MPPGEDAPRSTTLSPDDAFSVLANETRMDIVRTLSDSDEPLSFSELRESVGMPDSGKFNYHLDKLSGHFVRKTDEGYSLRQAGTRVIQAVLSGAVTEAPVVESTRIDEACPYCGAAIVVSFREERLHLYCSSCSGTFERPPEERSASVDEDYGYLGAILLPPAGVQDRSPAEMTQAAIIWATLEFAAGAGGICPRCSGRFEQAVEVCEAHEVSEEICDECNRRYAVQVHNECSICTFGYQGIVLLALTNSVAFQEFLIDNGINPMAPLPEQFLLIDVIHDEEVLSVDPFEGRFTFRIDGNALTVTLDDELEVVEATRHDGSG